MAAVNDMDGSSTQCITQCPGFDAVFKFLESFQVAFLLMAIVTSAHIDSLKQRSCADVMIAILLPVCKNAT